MMRILLFSSVVLLLAACAQGTPTPQPIIDTIVADQGDEITLGFPSNSGGTITIFLNVDGVGPNGVMLRGVSGFLQEGDPIRRDVEGRLMEVGVIQKIDESDWTVTIGMYQSAVEVDQ